MSNRRENIRVVVMCCPGRFQHYFLHQVAAQYQLQGVVICDQGPSTMEFSQRLLHYLSYFNLAKLGRYLSSRWGLPKYERESERRLQQQYPRFYAQQDIPSGLNVIKVENVNDPVVGEFIQALDVDIIVVNGTNLLREPVLSLCGALPYGVINLHTGLSPYARGGNCNLYTLLEGNPELVGATIHHIDSGIDSGDILKSLRPDMAADDPYEYIEAKVFLQGFAALLEAISEVAEGTASRVKQWQSGKLYLARTGYHYEPHQRLQVNKRIDSGMIQNYLQNKADRDAPIKLVG